MVLEESEDEFFRHMFWVVCRSALGIVEPGMQSKLFYERGRSCAFFRDGVFRARTEKVSAER